MSTTDTILATAKRTLLSESKSIADLVNYLDEDFAKSVTAIYNTKGRLVITGIGKSALIAQKIVATLNSTGTPSMFLHAAEAVHGDLGMVQPEDIIICISKSGNSPEIKVLAPLLKRFGNTLIGMTADKNSFLGKESHYILHAYVESEACPNNLAPTNSTTAQLVLGDALAICLMELKGFKDIDFAKFHPGGSLGKNLTAKVEQYVSQNKPEVSPESGIRDVIISVSGSKHGITVVMENENILGVITDGDIRRMLLNQDDISKVKASDIISKNPKSIDKNQLAKEAMKILKQFNIGQLIVTDNGKYYGIIDIHTLLDEGIS